MIQLLKIFSFSTLIILLISGCQVKFNKKQTFVNDFIPIAIRKEITALDNRVFKAIETNDPRKISDIISPELWEVVGDKIDTLFSVTSGILYSGEIIKLDDLYVENMNRNVLNRIFQDCQMMTTTLLSINH